MEKMYDTWYKMNASERETERSNKDSTSSGNMSQRSVTDQMENAAKIIKKL